MLGGGEELEIELKAVESESHIRGKNGFPFGMKGEVGQVGQPGFFGLNVMSHLDGLGDGQVSGVRFIAQPINDEDRNISDEIPDFRGDSRAVWQVDGPGAAIPIQAKAGGGNRTMGNREGDESDGAKLERALNSMGFRADISAVSVVEIEGVIESLMKTREGVGIRIDGNPVPVFHRVSAEVIESGDMIGVAVGVDHRIQPGNGSAKGLGAEVRGGVDDDAEVFILQPNGGAETAVPGIRGGADPALAGEHGNALGSAGAEKSQTHERLVEVEVEVEERTKWCPRG